MERRPVRTLADAETEIHVLRGQVQQFADMVMDHEQRFDTLQTWWWKRVWFWIDGWPWHDLNGEQRHRPWHGLRARLRRG